MVFLLVVVALAVVATIMVMHEIQHDGSRFAPRSTYFEPVSAHDRWEHPQHQ